MNRLLLTGVACALALVLTAYQEPAAGPARRPYFVDIAGKSNFAYISNNDFRLDVPGARKYFPQPMCGGVAILDFDGDGRMDILFSNGAALPELKKTGPAFYNCLLRNKGDGTFEDVTSRAGITGAQMDFSYGVAAGDYDNDGDPDIFFANTGRNTLYRNDGDGTFTDVTAESGIGGKPEHTLSVVAAWFDYDRDGRLDLVVSNYTYWTPAECGRGVNVPCDQRCVQGSRHFYCDPRRYPSVPHRLYRNLGNGKFKDVTKESKFEESPGKGMGISIAAILTAGSFAKMLPT